MTTPREPAQHPASVPWRGVAAYVVIALGLSWVISLATLLSGQNSLYGLPPSLLAMLTPSVATLIVMLVRHRRGIPRATALWPLRPAGRIVGYCLVGLALTVFPGFVAAVLAAAFGVIDLDLANFSMLRQQLAEVLPGFTGEGTGFPATAYLNWLLVLSVNFLATLPLAFGEEWGWRGYLLPRLLPLGVWPALLLSGLIHGVWHAPLMLFVGFVSGPAEGAAYFGMYVANIVVIGVLIGWLRLASRSVWPPVVMHGGQLAFLMVGFTTLADAGTETSLFVYPGGVGGVVGSAVLLAIAAVLGVTRQIRTRPGDPALSATAPGASYRESTPAK